MKLTKEPSLSPICTYYTNFRHQTRILPAMTLTKEPFLPFVPTTLFLPFIIICLQFGRYILAVVATDPI